MDKIFTSLLLGLLAFAVQLSAQAPTFSINPQSANVTMGGTVTVDVEVSDFDNILSTQYAVKWDPAILQFANITNINDVAFPGLSSSVSTPQSSTNVPPGQVNVGWFNPSFQGIDLIDGTVVFTLELTAIGCGTTDIIFDDPNSSISIEILTGNFVEVGLNPVIGTATVTGMDCGSQPSDVSFTISDEMVQGGEEVCLEVSVSDFTDLTDVALSINYNQSALSFNSISNLNLAGLTMGDFNTSTSGQITLDWSNAATTVSDGTVIFEICFQALLVGNTDVSFSDTPLAISVTDTDGMDVNFQGTDGTVTVTQPDTGSGGDILISIEDASVMEGESFCVSVTADNFENVVGMAFTLNYDDSQLQFTQVTNFNSNLALFGAANVANPSAGFVTVNYFNNNLTPTDLPDGAVLFDLCFQAINSGTSTITMTSDITPIEFSDPDENILPVDDSPALIDISGTSGGGDILIDIENASVTEGESFCVSVTADNFENVVGMAFTLNYNASQLQFTQVTNFNSNLALFGSANVANPSAGFITVNYFNNNLIPTDLPDGSVLFDICFEAINAGNSSITMTSDVAPIEFSDPDENVIPADDNPGSINIEMDVNTTDLFLTIEDVTVDPGDNFCLEVTTMNYDDVVGMAFTVTYDPNQLSFTQATNFNGDVSLFGSANVANPQPGFITVNYFENNLNPINLADGSVLFELCFEALGSGTTSDLHITSDITPIEFSDSNQDVIDFSYEEGTVDITGVFSELRLTAEDLTVPSTESFCAEITVENFEDIVGMAFTLNYDATHLQFQQATNFNTGLPLFGSANVANPSAGFITVNYFENNLNPTNLGDDEVLFEVCFLPVGADGTCSDLTFTSDITPIEFSDSNQDIVPFFSEEGTICLDDATPGVVGLAVGNASVDQGDSFCVPVTTDNFLDVAAMSFTMVYDASHLELTGVSNITGSLPGFTLNASFDTSTPGFVTVEWDGAAGVDLPDNTTLFELCFNAIGTPGTSSDIDFNSTVVPISLEDSNQNPLTLDATEGTIMIKPIFDGFLLTIANETIEPGESFCVPVTVQNFEDVVGFAFTINYDETQLQFNQVQNLNSNVEFFAIPSHFGLPPNQVPAGNITVSYFNNNLEPTDLSGTDPLFEMCFTAIGDDGDNSDICFSSDITPIEISDSNQEVIEFNGECGTINISAAQPPQIVDADVVNVACAGEETGSISLTVGGGEGGPFSYNWTHNGSPLATNTATLTNLASGTYNVTVTDQSTNLQATASYTIFAPSTSITINGGVSPPTCQGGCDGMITINVSGGTPGPGGYTYNWGTPGTTTLAGLCAGSQTVTVTDANGCEMTRTFTVPDGIGTPLNIADNTTPVSCNGENDGAVCLTVTGFTGAVFYTWSDGLNPSSCQSNLEAGDYNVTVVDGNSCRASATITIPEPEEIAVTGTVTNVLCFDEETGAISVSASGGNGGFVYNWSDGQAGPTATGLAAGSYTVSVSDDQSCLQTETFLIGQPLMPFHSNGATTTPIDLGNDGSITLDLEGGNPPYTVQWTPPTGPTVISQNLINLNVPGTYCFEAVDENGCTIDGCVDLLMTLRISNFIIVDACAGEDNGSVSVTVDGGTSPYTYSWSTGTSTGPSVINEGAGTVIVTVTDTNSESLTAEFEIGESPEIVIDSDLIPVTGNSTNTNGSITLNVSGGTAPLSYLWDNGATTSEITNLGTGTYCVTVTDSNFDNNCTATACFDVYYSDPLGVPVITTVNTSCSYTEDGAVTVEIPGGVPPFTITLSATGMADIIMGPSNDNIIVQNGLAPGNYNVTVVDNLGQTQDTNITVEAPMPLEYSYNSYQNALIGTCDGTINLSVTGGTPGYTVAWDNGGGTGMQPNSLCGDVTYTPTITDANGCEVQETVESVYISAFGVEVTDITDTDCPEDETGAIAIDVLGGDPNYQYVWKNSQGATVAMVEDVNDLPAGTYTLMITEGSGRQITETIVIGTSSNLAATAAVTSNYNGFNVSCADSADGQLEATATGSAGYAYEWIRLSDNMLVGTEATVATATAGEYQLVVIDELGCTTSEIIDVTAPAEIQIQANVKDVSCAGRTDGALQTVASGGVPSYVYNWDNGTFGSQQFNIADGSYRLTVTDFNNCTLDTVFVVDAPEPITITFESDPATDGCNGTLTAQVSGGTAPYQYNWMNIEGAVGAEATDLCPTINSNSEYLIQVIDANGCLSALTPAEVGDNRFPCLDERVVITPDGNGTNDEFLIFCVNDYPENHLEIFNRWGVPVFVGDNYDNTWSGTDADGNLLPEGPYYYVLTYVDPEGNTLQQKGSLTILRDE